MAYTIETRCIHPEQEMNNCDNTGALSFPIYQTATFVHPGVGRSTGYDYSRSQNPTRERVEQIVAGLEGGSDAIAFSSGMAGITVLMELLSPGDHLIVDSDLYGGSVRLFEHISRKNGILITEVDTSRELVEPYINENTRAIYIESPTNPMMRVSDIKGIADRAKAHGLLLIVDNTFLSPYFQNPIALGADIVVHSGTKFLSGHNDTLAGFVVVKDSSLAERLRFLAKTIGACLSPFDSFLVLRGIKTLALRMCRSQENAQAVAGWLKKRPEVTKVYYPGLPEHPGYELIKKQARGFGGMLSFTVKNAEFARALLANTKLIRFAESLGGTETLITYPLTQTHADVPEEKRLFNGITDCLLRLSCGIESPEDILFDLEQAFIEG